MPRAQNSFTSNMPQAPIAYSKVNKFELLHLAVRNVAPAPGNSLVPTDLNSAELDRAGVFLSDRGGKQSLGLAYVNSEFKDRLANRLLPIRDLFCSEQHRAAC